MMLDADEGRLKDTMGAGLLASIMRTIISPGATIYYSIMHSRRHPD